MRRMCDVILSPPKEMGQRDLPNKNENQKTKKSKMFEKKLVKCILKRLVYSNISLIVILIVI